MIGGRSFVVAATVAIGVLMAAAPAAAAAPSAAVVVPAQAPDPGSGTDPGTASGTGSATDPGAGTNPGSSTGTGPAAAGAAPAANPAPDAGSAPAGPSSPAVEGQVGPAVAPADTAAAVVVPDTAQLARDRTAAATPRSAAAVRLRPATRVDGTAQSARATWLAHGRPDRMIIVRRGSVDTVSGGVLQRHTLRYSGYLTLRGLASYVPSSWLSLDGATAQLSAALVLSVGVRLDVGSPVTTLALAGGATPSAAADIYTGGGSVTLRGVTVTSADAGTGAAMAVGPGRPFVVVARGGRLDAVDATIGDLGTKVERTGDPGVAFHAGSGGSLVRTKVVRNSVGLKLESSQGVRLEAVTVSQSDTDGLVLRGDVATTLVGVSAQGNGDNGVVVSGPSSPRPITGISTSGNHGYGLLVVSQTGPRINGVTTAGDGAGGLEISRSTDVRVSGLTARDEPTAVFTHVVSSGVVLDGLTVSGGRRGVVVEKTTTDLQLTRTTIDGTELGGSLGGHGIVVRDVAVTNSHTGVAVQRGAGNVTLERLAFTGGKNGLVVHPGTAGVVVRDLSADGVTSNAVRALSSGMQILGGRIEGSATGIDVQAPMAMSGVAMNRVSTGIRARSPGQVHADRIDVAAVSVGVDVAAGTSLLLVDSRVHALESIRGTVMERGQDDLSLPPMSVLGAIGVPLVLLAVVLEVLAAVRQWLRRRRGGGGGPARPPPPRGGGGPGGAGGGGGGWGWAAPPRGGSGGPDGPPEPARLVKAPAGLPDRVAVGTG